MTDTIVKRSKSHGSVWKPGELIAGQEADGTYFVLLCTREREVGPRGGVKAPAESVQITAPTWDAACDAVEAEGFERPTLTEDDVRRGR